MHIDNNTNQNTFKKHTLYLDNIVFSLQRSGGISVVWYELLKRLLNSSFNIKMLEYAGASNNIFRKSLTINEDMILSKTDRFLKINRYLNPNIKSDNKFIFHSSYYRTCPNPNAINVTTVHDFTYEKFSKGIKRIVHSKQKMNAIRNSDYVICISENTKRDLMKFMPEIDERKVRVIHNGVAEEYYYITDKEQYRNLPFPEKSYALFVGAREGYKNFKLVVETLSNVPDLNLVIVGRKLSEEETIFLNNKLGNRYKCLSGISNEQLNILYNGAYCLLYPSIYEGFGIPVIEAQKAGCPVVAYNASSIPEIIGKTPLLVNELNVGTLITCLELLRQKSIREDIVQEGLQNSKNFSWDKNYTETLDLYKEALSVRS